jgi:hypothetical protein
METCELAIYAWEEFYFETLRKLHMPVVVEIRRTRNRFGSISFNYVVAHFESLRLLSSPKEIFLFFEGLQVTQLIALNFEISRNGHP